LDGFDFRGYRIATVSGCLVIASILIHSWVHIFLGCGYQFHRPTADDYTNLSGNYQELFQQADEYSRVNDEE
jgi:hypothetical protein